VEAWEVRLEVLLVRQDEKVYAYMNNCPHMRWQLSFSDTGFYDEATRLITCRNHGGRFRANDGFGIDGPCQGKRLEAFPIEVVDGRVLFEE
jgi:nitrite reductase/ring-hydroxylating ferredoxin subunit